MGEVIEQQSEGKGAEALKELLENKNEFALCGCTVSPGFDFNDFEMPEKNQLLKLFPLHEEIINRLGYSKK